MSNKVSFDFDGVLSTDEGIACAMGLIDRGYDVCITTSRYEGLDNHYNQRLRDAIDLLGLDLDKVVFTNGESKFAFFEKNQDFVFHVDDDYVEVELIREYTDVRAIHWPDERHIIQQS
jgi:hypothetical protein